MSKSVLGLLAGLAVVTAAGRMKRGSYNGSRAHTQDRDFGTFSWGLTPHKVILQAVDHHVGKAGTYPLEAHQDSAMLSNLLDASERAGIKPFRFSGKDGRVGLRYTGNQLVKLLAALRTLDNDMGFEVDMEDSPGMLRTTILGTLGIEEV